MSLKYTLDEAVGAWRRTSQIVSFTAGHVNFQNDVVNVSVNASQRNVAREESIKYQTNYTVQKSNLSLLSQASSIDTSTEKLKAYGESTNITAIIREIPDTKSSEKKSKQFLEIWKNGFLSNSVDLQLLDKHGKVYTDGTFGCLSFSPDEKHLVYLAEKKESKKQSFIQYGMTAPTEGTNVGTEYEYLEDWGEQLTGKSQPVICIFNVDWEPFHSQDAVQIMNSCGKWSPGQLVWCSNQHLYGVAWHHNHPRRLGLIYCSNRPSQIFKLDITSNKYDWFGLKTKTAASPRYNSVSDMAVYLTSVAYGPHHKEQKIVTISSDGTVRQTEPKTSDSYLGMYNQSFPERCWSPDGKFVFFSTPCKSSLQSYALQLESSQIFKLSLPDDCTGSVLLDILEDYILISGVSLTRPDRLYIGRINYANMTEPIEWKCLSRNSDLAQAISLDADVLSFKVEATMEYDASLIFPKNPSKKTPLIVAPHGGPHSVSTDQFKSEAYFFSQLGFAVLVVNYRGSVGFGEEALNSLPGKVGTQDVQEVHNATLQMLEKHEFLDKETVFLFGGSHGGFLVTHLSGQYPDFYRAVSTRNPVIDIATMFPITDITDWTIVESGLGDGSELEKLLEPKTLTRMWEVSPIRYVNQVKAPTLLLVGKVDRRVPPTQSIEYYRALQLRGVKTRMLMYEDCHPLSQVPVDTDALINTVLWFQQSLE